jgi:hypothetical protein
MKIDYKITTWERFEIEDEHKGALLAFLKENPQATGIDIYNWYCDIGGDPYVEAMSDTEHHVRPEENGGFATLEVFDNPNDDAIFSNGN